MLYKVVLTFETVDEIQKCDVKATEQYSSVVLFIVLYTLKVVLHFVPVDEIQKCDHSKESYWAVLSSFVHDWDNHVINSNNGGHL